MSQCEHQHLWHGVMAALLSGGSVTPLARLICPACRCLCQVTVQPPLVSATAIKIQALR